MSFLHDAGAASIHNRNFKSRNNDGKVTVPARRLRQSQSLLSPLVDLYRHPTKPIEGLFRLWNGQELESTKEAEEKDGGNQDRHQILYLRMKEAETYEDWRAAASEIDILEGNSAWKNETESPEYNVRLIQTRLKQLDDARLDQDASRMLFLIRTSLHRGLGGMGDLRLYKHSHIGTKALIERYIESAQETLKELLKLSDRQQCDLDRRVILDSLLEARQSFGRSALLLSGGGTFGMNHIGVLKTLWEQKLVPRIVSGSSAGSIVCAVLCTKMDEEIPKVLAEFCYGDLNVFEKEGEEEGLLRKAARFLKHGSVFDIKIMISVLHGMFGDITFQEAYNRTRRILNISVSAEGLHELPRLLNYVTAPNVIIWSAVAASCSVPLIFSPAQLMAKDPKTGDHVPWNPSPIKWVDGSVDNDLPMTRLAEMFNVNHFIVSQVNPHVVPFLSKEDEVIASAAESSNSAVAAGPGWLHTMANLAKGEALHRMHVLAELGVFPNTFTKARSVLSQKYSGDITILPEISYSNFPKILTNPSTEFMEQAMLSGQRATWPKLSRVQNHCAIELALDSAVQHLRSSVVFSPSQVDLRLTTINTRAKGHQTTSNSRERAGKSYSVRHRHARSEVSPPPQNKRPRSFVDIGHKKHSPSHRLPRPSTPYEPGQPSLRFTAAEMMSSSAEEADADLFSAVESDECDSYSSESDPADDPMPELWPSTRQLFPSASQPTTPFLLTSFSRSYTHLAPMTPHLENLTPQQSGGGPSSPEIRYKRLFHGIGPESIIADDSEPEFTNPSLAYRGRRDSTSRRDSTGRRDSIQGMTPKDGEANKVTSKRPGTPKRVNSQTQQTLALDISGTRGMMLRRKRSKSTGLKGVLPPGRQ
jgi:TAG lipase/steryl ester hydrolase/phospholipase A2/LPA acyltransferase